MEKLKIYATYNTDTLHSNFAIGKDDSAFCSAFIDELTNMLDYGKKKKKDIVPVLRRIQSQKIVRLATVDIETGVVSPDYAVLVDLKDFEYKKVKEDKNNV